MTSADLRIDYPFAPPEDPYRLSPVLADLRDHRPVVTARLADGDPVLVVSRHRDVETVLADPRFSRAAAYRPGMPHVGFSHALRGTILGLDGPAHDRLRGPVERAFARVGRTAIEATVERVTDEL